MSKAVTLEPSKRPPRPFHPSKILLWIFFLFDFSSNYYIFFLYFLYFEIVVFYISVEALHPCTFQAPTSTIPTFKLEASKLQALKVESRHPWTFQGSTLTIPRFKLEASKLQALKVERWKPYTLEQSNLQAWNFQASSLKGGKVEPFHPWTFQGSTLSIPRLKLEASKLQVLRVERWNPFTL